MATNETTVGPWKVFEIRHPHHMGGEHIERRIGTAWDHAQLKGPAGVVNMIYGIGTKVGDKAIPMVGIGEADAHLIAAAPDMQTALQVAPVLSKYHGTNGFDLEQFIADYDAWQVQHRRPALAKSEQTR